MQQSAVKQMVLSALLLAVACALAQDGKKTFRWVDAQGQVHFGDRVPPQFAGGGHDNLDAQGRVVGGVARQATSAEQKAAAAEQAAHKARMQQRQKRRAYDYWLIQTFVRAEDLHIAQVEQLAILDGRIAIAHSNRADSQAKLATLSARLTIEPSNKALKSQVQMLQKSTAQNDQNVQQLQTERHVLLVRNHNDAERYRLLKSAAISPGD